MLLSAGQGGESAAVVEVAVSHEEEPHRPEGDPSDHQFAQEDGAARVSPCLR
jgi:hypothetical protein